MTRRHLVALTSIVAALVAAALWHARPPQPGESTPCPHPYLLAERGRWPILVCADVPELSAAELLRRADHACAEGTTGHSKSPQTLRVPRAQQLRVGADCALVREPIPGERRLLLGLMIDVNRATIAELEALPRIGPALARRITRERSRGGAFRDLAALARRVRGIGVKTVARLRGLAMAGARALTSVPDRAARGRRNRRVGARRARAGSTQPTSDQPTSRRRACLRNHSACQRSRARPSPRPRSSAGTRGGRR